MPTRWVSDLRAVCLRMCPYIADSDVTRDMYLAAGNLCWEAAMEFEVASRSVHCSVLEDQPDPEGDDKFRAAFMDIAMRFMAKVTFTRC